MGIQAYVEDNAALGFYRVYAVAPGESTLQEVTIFRGAPIEISSISNADPFGDQRMSFSIQNVTIYDKPGYGDLSWLAPWSQITIVWEPDSGLDAQTTRLLSDWSWEGVVASWSFRQDGSSGGITVECIGSLYILDNLLAIPFYPSRPVPYEVLISRIFDRASSYKMGLHKLTTVLNPSECLVYRSSDYRYTYLNPVFLEEGALWSGFATKNTGAREKALTGFISNLLSNMYSQTGKQWTLINKRNRNAELRVRPYYDEQYINANPFDENIMYIDAITPGVEISLSQDFSQTANVIYGTGTSLDGRKFSSPSGNYVYTPDNVNEVSYLYSEQVPQPFAFKSQVHPPQGNPEFDPSFTRKETTVDFAPGISAQQAIKVAERNLSIFNDPGFSGSVTLSVDPKLGNGFVYPRYLLKAGQSIVLYFNDQNKRIVFSITEVSIDLKEGKASLTVDSKRRDLLSVAEVNARARDALNIPRKLSVIGRQGDIPQQDYLRPWNPEKSGILPGGEKQNAFKLFNLIDSYGSVFPWTDITTKYNPLSAYKDAYVKIGPASTTNPDQNWAGPIPVLLSANGSIDLSQIAAYDSFGNVKPVEFHVSLYGNSAVSTTDMPQIVNRHQDVPRTILKSFYSSPYCYLDFDEPHGIPVGAKGWTITVPTAVSSTWNVTNVSVTAVSSTRVKYYKVGGPTSSNGPTGGVVTVMKNTVPRQRANTTTKIYSSDYVIEYDSVADSYLVSIKTGDAYGTADNTVTVSGSTINTGMNGSYVTVASGRPGYSSYYVNSNVSTGTFSENVVIDYASNAGYISGAYPFFEYAFENAYEDGTLITATENAGVLDHVNPSQNSNLIVGWGSYWQPAGYGNGLFTQGALKAGTLIDEESWSYNTENQVTHYSSFQVPASNLNSPNFGYAYAMIYCDDQGADDVYFLGRFLPSSGA